MFFNLICSAELIQGLTPKQANLTFSIMRIRCWALSASATKAEDGVVLRQMRGMRIVSSLMHFVLPVGILGLVITAAVGRSVCLPQHKLPFLIPEIFLQQH